MRALVLLNGDLHLGAWNIIPELSGPWDCLICADGGGRYALRLGLQPDVLLGDFDSLAPAVQQMVAAKCVYTFPSAKDETDAELAAREALRRGATEIVLAAALGGRIDHTLGNIGLLRLIRQHGAAAVATDGKQYVWLVAPEQSPFIIDGAVGDGISLVPFCGRVTGVTLTGTRWPLENATLEVGLTRSISNELISSPASVSVGAGELLVIRSCGRIE